MDLGYIALAALLIPLALVFAWLFGLPVAVWEALRPPTKR